LRVQNMTDFPGKQFARRMTGGKRPWEQDPCVDYTRLTKREMMTWVMSQEEVRGHW